MTPAPKKWMRHWGRYLLLLLLILAVVELLWLLKGLPDFDELESFDPPFATRIYSADSVLLGEYFHEHRVYVPLQDISPWVPAATIALEDHRFRQHWGVDLYRILQAIVIDLRHLSFKQGGSTLTQQLAKNLFLTQEKSITRKLREILTAIQLERTYSKDEILEMYLTLSYFGHGAYGVQAAAGLYFDKLPAELEPQEAALLVAMLRAPALYSPWNHPGRSLRRRNLVINMMERQGLLTPLEADTTRALPLGVQEARNINHTLAPYFVEYVRQQLEEMRGLSVKPDSTLNLPALREDIYDNGLNIQTTLNYRFQTLAESLLTHQLLVQDTIARRYFKWRGGREYLQLRQPDITVERLDSLVSDTLLIDSLMQNHLVPQGAFIALSPRTGDILAMIGGRDFDLYKFNRAVQAVRQPGSLFKPILYLEALEAGYTASYRIPNQDIVVQEANGKRWTPSNWDGSRGGEVSLRKGLEKSLNLISVRLMMEAIPPHRVVKRAQSLGMTTSLDPDYTLALGSSGVIPIEIASAYGVFADQGIYHAPQAISTIQDRHGNLVHRFSSPGEVVLSKASAFLITSLLRGVVDNGTAGALRWKWGFYQPVAGKTGTTNSFTDAWFIGFTPDIVVAVWIGMDDPAFKLGRNQYGGVVALPVFAAFMKQLYREGWLDKAEFSIPDEIIELEICTETGAPATSLCPHIATEYFLDGTVPLQRCQLHAH
jgi:penicillin-binding protein 1A